MKNKDNLSGIDSFGISFGVQGSSAEVGRSSANAKPDGNGSVDVRDAGRSSPSEPDARILHSEGNPQAVNELPEPGPFRLVVLSELVGRPEFNIGGLPLGLPVAIDNASFDEVMQGVAPGVSLPLRDPFDGSPLRVEVRWTNLKGFRPGELVERISCLKGLADAHDALHRFGRRELNWAGLHRELGQCLTKDSWASEILSGLGQTGQEQVVRQGSPRPPAAASNSVLDDLLASVDLPATESAPSPTVSPNVSGVNSLLGSVALGGKPPDAKLAGDLHAAKARVDSALQSLLLSILQHEEVRRLESAWRSLKLLTDQIPGGSSVIVEVVPVGSEAVTDALDSLIASQHGDSDAAPIDLVVVDLPLTPAANDLERAQQWAERAAALPAPLVVNGTPALLGMSDLAALGRTRRRLTNVDDPRAVALRALSAREASRWLAIALNGPLLRGAYTAQSSRVRNIAFTEESTGTRSLVFGGASMVVAAAIAKAFARNGHPFSFTGPQDGSISGLAIHQPDSDPSAPAIPVESLVTLEAQDEAARAGLILVGSPANRDTAIVTRSPMLFRGEAVARGADTAASLSLADQLFVTRCANGLRQIAAAIPLGTPSGAVSEVARITLADLFPRGSRGGPEILARVTGGTLEVTVRPHHYAGLGLEEITLGAPLGG